MNNSFKAHLMLSLGALIGGLNYTISKMVMPDFAKPLSIVVTRGFVSIIVFWVIHFLFVNEKVKKEDHGRIFLASVFGVALNQTTFYIGLNYTSPINASLMMTITPIFVLIISTIILKEKISATKIIGVLLGSTGAALLITNSQATHVEGLFSGDILVLINAISWACFLVTVKPLMQKYNPFTILKWIFLLGFLLVLPAGLEDFLDTNWQGFTTQAFWALAFVVVFATLISYFLNSAVLKYVDPSIAGSYIYLQPLLAAVVAISWGKDIFNLEKLSYLVIILSGVYLVSFKNNKK